MVGPPPASAARKPRPSREKNLVRKRAEYLAIQSAGARVNGDCLVFILARRAATEPEPRLGITASRRIGGAVERNRAKRLIREAFRALIDQLPVGVDIVVIVRKPLGDRKLVDVLGEWRRALPHIQRKAKV